MPYFGHRFATWSILVTVSSTIANSEATDKSTLYPVLQVQPNEDETVEPAAEAGTDAAPDRTTSPAPTAVEGAAETESEVLLVEPPPPPPPKEVLQPLDITPFVK